MKIAINKSWFLPNEECKKGLKAIVIFYAILTILGLIFGAIDKFYYWPKSKSETIKYEADDSYEPPSARYII